MQTANIIFKRYFKMCCNGYEWNSRQKQSRFIIYALNAHTALHHQQNDGVLVGLSRSSSWAHEQNDLTFPVTNEKSRIPSDHQSAAWL